VPGVPSLSLHATRGRLARFEPWAPVLAINALPTSSSTRNPPPDSDCLNCSTGTLELSNGIIPGTALRRTSPNIGSQIGRCPDRREHDSVALIVSPCGTSVLPRLPAFPAWVLEFPCDYIDHSLSSCSCALFGDNANYRTILLSKPWTPLRPSLQLWSCSRPPVKFALSAIH